MSYGGNGMYYYKQIDRETGQQLAVLSCTAELLDNHETIRLEQLTEEEYELESSLIPLESE